MKFFNQPWKLLFALAFLAQGLAYSYAQETPLPPAVTQEEEVENSTDDNDTEEETTKSPQSSSSIEDLPQISYDLQALPFPTRRMHELILEAAKSGDVEKLRTYIGTGDSSTMLSLGDRDGDPIDFLKRESGDENGHETLAILQDILEAGYVHLDKGTDRELYVWPYFFAYPLDKLSDPQMVELFRIVTYGDFQNMKDFGGYIFYRAGITPSGRWTFFVAGD